MKPETYPDNQAAYKDLTKPVAPDSMPFAEDGPPDANVAQDGHCILMETGEQARPDTGDPCEDGRDAR